MFAEYPESGRHFDEQMRLWTDTHVRAIVDAYDFAKHNTVVDVGGGKGSLITAILQANTGIRGLLFDQASVIEQAKSQIAEAELTGRCDAVAGSFLESVPAGADASFIKHVLHDWDDSEADPISDNDEVE